MLESQECLCPHCETELKKGCLGSKFCTPCSVQKHKICDVCGAEYSYEYDECPACTADKNKNLF
ncbi:MAG: hypothetical protein LBS81_01205 [Endomicrobium sp.]|jgi:hypothetical protein|nr:hypothetical protein [Endomicrobium sp.]